MSNKYTATIPNALSDTKFAGRVTRDVESRFAPSGTQVANVSMAVSRRWFDEKEQGENKWKETTAFVTVAIWGEQAVSRAINLKKGDIVLCEASMADLSAQVYQANGEARASLQFSRGQVYRIAWTGDTSVNVPTEEDINTLHPVVPADENIPF